MNIRIVGEHRQSYISDITAVGDESNKLIPDKYADRANLEVTYRHMLILSLVWKNNYPEILFILNRGMLDKQVRLGNGLSSLNEIGLNLLTWSRVTLLTGAREG
jgi:hypothetical protein